MEGPAAERRRQDWGEVAALKRQAVPGRSRSVQRWLRGPVEAMQVRPGTTPPSSGGSPAQEEIRLFPEMMAAGTIPPEEADRWRAAL